MNKFTFIDLFAGGIKKLLGKYYIKLVRKLALKLSENRFALNLKT